MTVDRRAFLNRRHCSGRGCKFDLPEDLTAHDTNQLNMDRWSLAGTSNWTRLDLRPTLPLATTNWAAVHRATKMKLCPILFRHSPLSASLLL